jgi:hypothetical protein
VLATFDAAMDWNTTSCRTESCDAASGSWRSVPWRESSRAAAGRRFGRLAERCVRVRPVTVSEEWAKPVRDDLPRGS